VFLHNDFSDQGDVGTDKALQHDLIRRSAMLNTDEDTNEAVESRSKAGSTCSVAADGSGAWESSRLNNVRPFGALSGYAQVQIAG
jgi:hypothetical protein